MIIFLDGKFFRKKEAKISILDHGFLYGDGVFTTLRTYNRKIFCLKEHVDRLFQSAKIIDLKVPWTKNQIMEWTQKALEKNKSEFPEARIRINISRGVGSDVPIDYTDSCRPSISIIVSKLPQHNPIIYLKGVSVITKNMERILPKSKNYSFLVSVMALKEARVKGYWDAILVDNEGHVTESTTGNIFIVKNNKLITPSRKILEGITRQQVLEIAKENKIKVYKRIFKVNESLKADEVFITGTTKEIVPVVKINNRKIGNGKPGELTIKLIKEFRERKEKFRG